MGSYKSTSRIAVILLATSLLVSACAQQTSQNARKGGVLGGGGFSKSDIGTVIGAAGGAALGNKVGRGTGRVVGIAVGTLIGAGLGHEIGASLDRADINYYQRAQQTALENANAGEALPWRNPKSGNSGTITPSNYYTADNGQYCREFTQEIHIGGRVEEGYGTACREEDGSWRIVGNN
jgi:surface antigen